MKIKLFFLLAFTLFFAKMSTVSAMPKCSELTTEDLQFYKSLNRPDIYDLSCSNGTPYSNDYINRITNSSDFIAYRYFVNKIDVTPFEQLDGYCGPASMKQAIHAVKGTSKSQLYYGSLIGTNTSSGTDQRYIAGAMNSELEISRYTYVWTNNISNSEFYSLISDSIDLGYPPIMHIRMENMPAYNYSLVGGHFVTINGYTLQAVFDDDYSPISIYYVDPYKGYNNGSSFGENMVSLPIIKAAGYSGVLVYAV